MEKTETSIIMAYKKAYESAGMVVIPLAGGTKVPVKGLDLDAIYNGSEPEEGLWKPGVNIGIVTGRSNLVVFDCDTQEAVEFFMNRPGYIKTATVVTRRGRHFYYRLKGDLPELHPTQWKKPEENISIDLKTGKTYVVAPPSVVNGHTYIWDPNDWSWAPPIAEIAKNEYFHILEELNFCAGKKSTVTSPPTITSPSTVTSPPNGNGKSSISEPEIVSRIVDVVLPYYIPGQRQQLVLGLVGFLRKAGLTQNLAESVVQRLHNISGDSDYLYQRLSAVALTYTKDLDEVAGYTMLSEMMAEEDLAMLKSIVAPLPGPEKDEKAEKVIYTDGVPKEIYMLRDGAWWYVKEEGKDKIKERICDEFHIVCKMRQVEGERRTFLQVRTKDLEHIIIPINTIKSEPEDIIGNCINLRSKFDKLIYWLIQQAPYFKMFERTGWHGDLFIHPALDYPQKVIRLPDVIQRLFIRRNTEKQHQFIVDILSEGGLLAAKIVFSVSSLFLENQGYTVIDIGERAVGKTLTTILAGNIFYYASRPTTAKATNTGMELLLAKLRHLPVIFDETAFSWDDTMQSLIFILSSGWGKMRGTKTLEISLSELSSVVFLTSERELDFSRLGAERRCISVRAQHTQDYTRKYSINDLVQISKTCVGCGVDYIETLNQNKKIPAPTGIFERYTAFTFGSAVEKALLFLEDFYGQDFTATRDCIDAILASQHAEASRSVWDIFRERFSVWCAQNAQRFVRRYIDVTVEQGERRKVERVDTPMRDCVGYRDEVSHELHIFTRVFRTFCIDEQLPLETILMEAKTRRMLKSSETTRYRGVKHIPGLKQKVAVYTFDLSLIL